MQSLSTNRAVLLDAQVDMNRKYSIGVFSIW